ncbi:MAG TPA: hypothetical protein VGO06_13570 [Bosea sp. (in: a-proteobacteria)]|jgi:hypothetical protein|uniref:DUF6894 family protein n=1 Tax=Bosea sp. (in: a-proteobacteria) TaxID=1871050 RepID=UPI002E0F16BA|nr:hypothetical protein [Bosea sp. (in: a-proteobacteria)]
MPLYRFAVDDGRHVDLTDAIEHPSDAVAVRDAHRALAELVADLPEAAQAEFRIAVQAPSGTVIYQASVTFRGETAADMKARGLNGGPTK